MNSVIVLVHNVKVRSVEILGMTETCFQTLIETADQPYEIILVDNGSNDDGVTLEFLKNWSTRFQGAGAGALVLRNEENLAVSRCWNEAIAVAQGDVMLLINNDVVFERRGWMSALTAPVHLSQVGISGGHGMSWNGLSFLEGAFLAFRKEVAQQVAENGKIFDEQFEFTCEEVDFATRVQRAGYEIRETNIENSGMVRHLHHGTLSWTNEEGGINGRSALLIMHDCRMKLCRKWGLPDRVND